MKLSKILLAILSLLPLLAVGLWASYPPVSAAPQMSDTCSDGKLLVVDASNKRYKCISADVPLVYRAKSVNLNSGVNTDVATITGFPSRFIVRRVTFENASGTPTLATIGVFTGAGGTGTTVVTAQALASLSATTVYLDATLAVTSTVLTSSSLTLRNIAVAGSAMTVDVSVEVTPLL